MDFQTLNYAVGEGVATITLNRPDEANALNGRSFEEFWEAALLCDDDPAVRAVVITATGRFFCAGGDLKDFNDKGDAMPGYLTRSASLFHAGITRFQRMDAPVIMAVNGVAAGAGISLVSAGDIAIAAESASFVSAYTASGLTPDGSSTYFLAKHVGLMRAKELILLNRKLSAAEAVEWGLVTRTVPDDALMDEAMSMAKRFATGPTKAFGGAKRLLLSAFDGSLEQQLELETNSIADMARTRDGRVGIDAFANRRKPEFEGR